MYSVLIDDAFTVGLIDPAACTVQEAISNFRLDDNFQARQTLSHKKNQAIHTVVGNFCSVDTRARISQF